LVIFTPLINSKWSLMNCQKELKKKTLRKKITP
jgi:hypothetical protein